jgi:Na+/proline symporter
VRGLYALLASAVLLTAAGQARADGTTAPSPEAACADQVHAIAAVMETDARRTRVWYWAWMAAGTTLLVGQGGLAAITDGNDRIEFAVGAATSVFIPAVLLLHPPAVLSGAPALDSRLQATTVSGRLGDPCIALSRARELLAQSASDQALQTGLAAHTFVIGGNIAVGLLLGIAFHDWWGAAKQAVGGTAVGELQVLTLPTGSLRFARANDGGGGAGLGAGIATGLRSNLELGQGRLPIVVPFVLSGTF